MYGFLNFVIDCFKSKLENGGKSVIVKGTWENFGNGSCF
jgi:hypothetical protein